MDNTINPVSGATQTYQASVVRVPSSPAPSDVPVTVPVQKAAEPAVSIPDTSSSDEYEAAARKAALSFKDVYALGDQNFSIFKDASGKYITRYVSLRDGKVTYTPAPNFVRQIAAGESVPTRVAISA